MVCVVCGGHVSSADSYEDESGTYCPAHSPIAGMFCAHCLRSGVALINVHGDGEPALYVCGDCRDL